jgi:hypothetical protein
MTAQYLKKLSSLSVSDQPEYHGLQVASPATFEASGAPSATSLPSEVLGAVAAVDGDDDYVGYVVECVQAVNEENVGLRRRVVAADYDAGPPEELTLSVDAFPSAIHAEDRFKLYLPPHGIAVETTGGSASQVDAAGRDEADDYWNGTAQEGGYRLEVIEADNAVATDRPLVSDFTSATGRFSLGTNLSGVTAIGDLFEPWCDPEWLSFAVELTQDDIPVDVFTGDLYSEGAVKGLRGGSITGELAFRGSGDATHAEVHRFLRPLFDSDDGADLTATAAGTTTSVAFDAGAAEANALYCTAEGDVFCSLDDATTPIVPSPSLRTAPGDNTTIARLTTYRPSSDVNLSLAAKAYAGNGILAYLWGWLPLATFSMERGQPLKVSLSGEVCDWMELFKDSAGDAIERAWALSRPSVAFKKLSDIRVVIGGTSYSARKVTFNPGPQATKEVNLAAPNHVGGWTLTGWDPRGEIEVYVDATNRVALDDFKAGRQRTILVQAGDTPDDPGVFAIWAYSCQYTGTAKGEDSGKITMTLPFKVNRVASFSYSPFLLGVR